jgi:hypothetical protein|tara:strand:- start:550 stop:954 length:405 start_codon:yes stop_codon:yes gene_type:complete
MSEFKVVRNVTVVNTRVINPVQRDFGKQYSLLLQGSELSNVGLKPTKDESYWVNSNAEYPNGDAIAPIPMINKSKQPVTTELGEGSEIELVFKVVMTKKGQYFNLAAIKVIKFVKPFDIFDCFDELESDPLAQF